MAIHDDISNSVIEKAIEKLGRDSFTTFHLIDIFEIHEKDLVIDIQGWSERNWRSIFGKAIKRYSVQTNKIRQVSPPNETPARWKKVTI
jgi:cytidylate kinase